MEWDAFEAGERRGVEGGGGAEGEGGGGGDGGPKAVWNCLPVRGSVTVKNTLEAFKVRSIFLVIIKRYL